MINVNNDIFTNARSTDLIDMVCDHCHSTYKIMKATINVSIKRNLKNTFCSRKCGGLYKVVKPSALQICMQCAKEFIPKHYSKINGVYVAKFCSTSCAGSHNNAHKTYGYRRSKLEKWLEGELTTAYPNIAFTFNSSNVIGAELDIYIDSLKLAFELNGIFHYEPLYGADLLKKTQLRDQNKFQLCQQHNISLCVIDTMSQKYFKPKTSIKFLEIIKTIIDQSLSHTV